MTTPGQTVGPFFGLAMPRAGEEHPVAPGTPGAVRLTGRVLDGEGAPVPDALLELCHPGAYARVGTDSEGRYAVTTLRPAGAFLPVAVFARGLLNRLFTRIYLPDAAMETDALLRRLDAEGRRTLVAIAVGDTLHFDIRLQGANETVFLAFPGHQP